MLFGQLENALVVITFYWNIGVDRHINFGMEKDKSKPFIDNHEALLEAVEDHFMNELKVNPVEVIYKFLSTKKGKIAFKLSY